MINNDRIKYCKLYKGERTNQYKGDLGLIWDYERIWVENDDPEFYAQILEDYKLYGLSDFSPDDGVPLTLKAMIWSRHAHWYGANDIEGFKDWYTKAMDKINKRIKKAQHIGPQRQLPKPPQT